MCQTGQDEAVGGPRGEPVRHITMISADAARLISHEAFAHLNVD
jgi:hypothetical protein